MYILFFTYIILMMLSVFFNRKNLKYYFMIISLVFAILAFIYVPNNRMDLYRHYNMLEMCRQYGFDYIINSNDYKNLPIAAIYMYVISMFKLNGFLPFITAYIVYKLSLNLVYYSGIRYNISRKSMLLTAYFFIGTSNYMGIISGIRNPLAITIFIYLLYWEIIERRYVKFCWIGYILVCFVHLSVFILLFFRILLLVYNRYSKFLIKILIFGWSLFLPSILKIANYFNNIPIVNYIISKVNSYDIREANAVADVKVYTIVYSTLLITCIFIAFTYYKKYRKSEKNKQIVKYFNMFIIFSLFVIGSISQYHLFVRMNRALALMSIPILNYINGDNVKIGYKWDLSIEKIMYMIIIIETILFVMFLFNGQYTLYKIR